MKTITFVQLNLLKILAYIFFLACTSGCTMDDIDQVLRTPAHAEVLPEEPPPVVSQSSTPPALDPRVDRLASDVSAMKDQLASIADSLKQKAEAPPQPKVDEPENSLMEVQVIGPQDCAPCDVVVNDLNSSGLFKAFKRADIPPNYARIAARNGGYPVVVFQAGGTEHYVCPWRGVSSFAGVVATTVMQSVLPKQMKTGMSEPTPAYSDPIYFTGYGQSSWSWPGDLRVHLTYPPHSLSTYQVRRMTRAQCIQVHSAYHNRYGAKQAAKTDKMMVKHDAREERKQNRYERGGLFGAIFGPRNRTAEYRYTTIAPTVQYRTYYTPRVRTYRYSYSVCPSC